MIAFEAVIAACSLPLPLPLPQAAHQDQVVEAANASARGPVPLEAVGMHTRGAGQEAGLPSRLSPHWQASQLRAQRAPCLLGQWAPASQSLDQRVTAWFDARMRARRAPAREQTRALKHGLGLV